MSQDILRSNPSRTAVSAPSRYDDLSIPKTPKVKITENQQKVIQDKYLKDAPSVEAWLYNVARNVALSEIFYLKHIPLEKITEGVKFEVKEYEVGRGEFVQMILFHTPCKSFEEQDRNFKHLLQNLYRLAEEDEEARRVVDETTRNFYSVMAKWEFLPNSPTLMNAGRDLQQLSACYVLPIEDSIDAWGDLVKQTMLIHKSGGGTGFSGCRVRPKGDTVRTTKGVASGAISPLMIINHTTEEIKQGGTRRGANMGILPYHHPDVLEFISVKNTSGHLENFNISVAVDDKFFEYLRQDREYDLVNPRTGEAVGRARARDVFQKMCEGAWKTGDPGCIFIQRINESLSNPTPTLGLIEATNPCGEQPLLPYEPCNLGSINLSKFVREGEVDWKALEKVTQLATRFLDNVIDVNNYPIDRIELMAKGNRRIGLGVMGWAEMLVLLGIPYDSAEALQKAEEVMRFINEKALEASEELAQERGVFPFFKNSVYDEEGSYAREGVKGHRPRHCARTTIAPTGTIGIAAGLQGGGIEPFFGIVYTRYNAKALDALKRGEKPHDQDVFYEVNPHFRNLAYERAFFGLNEKELWQKIADHHASVRGIKEIPESVQRHFASAHDVSVEYHIRHQAIFQKYVDNGVSKTINLPHSATVEDIKKTYLLAYELGCKGITVYRDGCKAQQVLNLSSSTPAKKKERNLLEGIGSVYYKFQTGYGPVHIHIDYDEDGTPFRVFVNTTPIGTEVAGLSSVLGIMISKYLEMGGDITEIIKHLNSIKSDKPYGFGPGRIESIPHAISIALKRFLTKSGIEKSRSREVKPSAVGRQPSGNREQGKVGESKSQGVEESRSREVQGSESPRVKDQEPSNGHDGGDQKIFQVGKQEHCPQCYSPNIAYLEGCHGPTCHDCGYSECG